MPLRHLLASGTARGTRAVDLKKKKENRMMTRALLSKVWALEEELRQKESPPRAPGKNTMLPVLRHLVQRLRGMVQQPARVGGNDRRGLLGSCSLGVLYVSVEDWAVRESSAGMELVCPFEEVRGYVGHELAIFVHSEDQHALRKLRAQIQNFVPGAAVAVSLRMLRVCLDGEVLVMGYEPLHFEVAHVAADAGRGGEVHALLTCALEPGAVEPLTFTALDRLGFTAAAGAVSGRLALERQTFVRDFRAPEDTGGSADAAEALRRVSNQTFTLFDDMIAWVRTGVMFKVAKSFIRLHFMAGLAPDGVPWVCRSIAAEAVGFSSWYRHFFHARLSGKFNWIPLLSSDPRPCLVGVLKPRLSSVGAMGSIEVATLAFHREPGASGRRSIMAVSRLEMAEKPDANVRVVGRARTMYWGRRSKGSPPELFEMIGHGTGPPLPEVALEFFRFDRDKVERAPPA